MALPIFMKLKKMLIRFLLSSALIAKIIDAAYSDGDYGVDRPNDDLPNMLQFNQSYNVSMLLQ